MRLPRMAEVLERMCQEATRQNRSYMEFLDELLSEEQRARYERNVAIKTRLAHLPYHKTMGEFDYSFQPSVDKKQIAELLGRRFVEHAENVVLLGPPGVGKTHIAVALALEAIKRGYTAYFVTMQRLVDYLSEADAAEPLRVRMGVLLRPKLLIIDEVGYLPLDRRAANWFFELISRRYERSSVVLTSNKSFSDWASLFPDVAIASAILDRLLHHSTTINIRGGESYRLREKRKAGLLSRAEGEAVHG